MPPPSESTEIEVEVVEIDGMTAASASGRSEDHEAPRHSFEGAWRQARHFDLRRIKPRWWPLWVMAALVALAIVMTLGVATAIAFLLVRLAWRLLGRLFR